MPTNLRDTGCCAVYEIDDLSHSDTPEDAVKSIARQVDNNRPSLIFFTGVMKRVCSDHASDRTDDYGGKLARYIRAKKLGKVKFTGKVLNPHTGNTVGMWVWTIDRKKFAKVVPIPPEPRRYNYY